MLIYKGKAKNLTWQAITVIWLKFTRPLEFLETVDFSKN